MTNLKVSEKEMLGYLGRWKHCSQADQCAPDEMKRCIETEDAIRVAIEERWPKVNEQFIEFAQNILNPYPHLGRSYAPSKSSIRQVLREAGVEITDE